MSSHREPLFSFTSPLYRVLWGLYPLVLAGCSQTLDTDTIEAAIQAEIEQQGRRLSVRFVDCPENIQPKAEGHFRCVAELEKPEGTFAIHVTQQDSQGSVTWEIPNSKVMLNLERLEHRFQETLSQEVGILPMPTIDCGDTYRANQPGDAFECDVVGNVTDGADRLEAILVRADAQGNLQWQEIRQRQPETEQ
ncbi:MAG: DUF4333 domain-containing protein [Cyanothece sp. SIO1E1]|nr:DUF4333 domain-containing protein [Cyanothece sp. SIO1E1]